MERDKSSGFYVIDALALKHPAGKPFHLEERLRSRRRTRAPKDNQMEDTGGEGVSNDTADMVEDENGDSIMQNADSHDHDHERSRRAFIEARRSKLARRNSHVRSVMASQRKQAGMDKAAGKRRIMDTLAAAERKRNGIIENQVRTVASKNVRAKEIAEAQQKKEAEEAAARRRALEARLSASESRRRAVAMTPRSRLLNSTEMAPQDSLEITSRRDQAAVQIQRWWRHAGLMPLLRAWFKTDFSLDQAKSLTFDKVIKVVQSKLVIRAAAAIISYWKRFGVQVGAKSIDWKNPSRVFLSAYLIVAHTQEIMPTIAAEEEAVHRAAITLLNEFEDWKERDTRKIVDGLIAHWLDLEKLWLSVMEQIDAEEQWRPRIEEQQTVIMSRLKRFGESALDRLKTERRRLHEEFNLFDDEESDAGMDTGDEAARYSTDDGMSSNNDDEGKLRTRSIPIPGGGRRPSTPNSMDALSTSPQRFPPKFMQPSPSPMVTVPPEVEPRLSASTEQHPELASSFGTSLSKEQLAHELTLDPEFALKRPTLSPLEEQVQKTTKRAFFDRVREAFNRGDLDAFLPAFIEDMKMQIKSMISDKGKIATEINEYLDITFIRQQIAHKTLNLKLLFGYIVNKLSQLCAPVRDPTIRGLTASIQSATSAGDLVAVIEQILELLEDMKLDLANYRLQSLRPHMKTVAVEYERSRFKKAIERGEVTTERTRAWLTAAVKDKEAVAKARNPEQVDIPENKVRFTEAFHDGILSLVFGNNAVSPEQLPETMTMDAARLFKFQNDGQMITVVAALLMLSQNAVPELRGDKAFLQGLKETLLVLLQDPEGLTVENLSIQVLTHVKSLLEQRGKKPLDDERTNLIKTMVEKTISTKDPVFGLLRRRVSAAVKAHVVNGAFKREGLEKAGLEYVRAELEAFSFKVATWVKFNGEVYAEWYDEILRDLI
ncbi:hypothetical protein HDU76_009627 [Blyttiomyces sp. JEL0837]|nr:hypothetical protein HDU76_009627 [Blyttiomyces sp. JEL0837]